MTDNEENNQLIEKEPELAQVVESTDKDINGNNCIAYVQILSRDTKD